MRLSRPLYLPGNGGQILVRKASKEVRGGGMSPRRTSDAVTGVRLVVSARIRATSGFVQACFNDPVVI